MTPLKYKLLDKWGNMICRCRHDYDAALIASKYEVGAKIRNEQLGTAGRVVCTVDHTLVGDYENIYRAIQRGETAVQAAMRKRA